MGGGPCSWAVEDHRRAGLRVLATPDAARTFNDDLDRVGREMGVEIIADEAGRKLAAGGDFAHVEFRDFDYDAIRARLPRSAWCCVPTPWRWLFSITARRRPTSATGSSAWITWPTAWRRPAPERLAFRAQVPPVMTRLQRWARQRQRNRAAGDVMDTAPAAVLGALDDPPLSGIPTRWSPTWATFIRWLSSSGTAIHPPI